MLAIAKSATLAEVQNFAGIDNSFESFPHRNCKFRQTCYHANRNTFYDFQFTIQ